MNENVNKNYYGNLFKDFPDVVKVKELKQMLPRMGKNKTIYSKKIGRDYYIPKVSIIKYLMEK